MSDIGDDRLEPYQIISAVSAKHHQPNELRIEIAIGLGCFACVVLLPIQTFYQFGWVLALIAGGLAAFIAYEKLNASRCEWWQSEIISKSFRVSDVGFRPADHEGPEPARSIQPGDFISKFDSLINGSGTGAVEMMTIPQLQEMAKEFVIAKVFTRDGERANIAVLGRQQTYKYRLDRNFWLWGHLGQRTSLQWGDLEEADEIARAFADLITLLEYRMPALPEVIIARNLRQRHHDVRAVRSALALAERGKLIDRRHGNRWLELAKVFDPKALVDGHEGCRVSLTECGYIWESATRDRGQIDSSSGLSINFYDQSYQVTHTDKLQNFMNISAGSLHIWQNLAHPDTDLLARELRTLVSEMRRREASSQEHRDAAETVKLAEASARNGDGPGAVSYLSRLAPIGRWISDVAKDVSAQLVVAIIEAIVHSRP